MTAMIVARALRGRRSGDGWLCHCPVLGHGRGRGDSNPSLLVKDGETSVLVRCFAGCSSSDVIEQLRSDGLVAPRAGGRPSFVRPQGAHTRDQATQDIHAARSADRVTRIWRSSQQLAGTLAGRRYLEELRGLPEPHPDCLRFHPRLHHPRAQESLPALLAAVQVDDGAIVAVQATFLDPVDGRKARLEQSRWTFGQLQVGAVRLAVPGEVLGLAEGVETALAAQHLVGVPTWACLGAGRMGAVPIPSTVREVHLFVDDDPPGLKAAERTAAKHRHLRVVLRRPPSDFKDWNDVAMERMP